MKLTERTLVELMSHEGIVREAYKDSRGIWTWGVGVTNASGHQVHPRYLDKPQPLDKCISIFEWLLREKYWPAVERAFKGKFLQEHEQAGALSFHYNTGAIEIANWVREYNKGNTEEAYNAIMFWSKPPEIIPRRKAERDLFFKAEWSNDGTVTEYKVSKPSYRPDWNSATKLEVELQGI